MIGGYRPVGSNGIDALLVGYYDEPARGSQGRCGLASFLISVAKSSRR